MESDGGGEGLRADWYIDNRRRPELKRTPKPFLPNPASGMEQVRVKVAGPVYGKFEYLFDRGIGDWLPLFDDKSHVIVSETDQPTLESLNLVPREDQPWMRVRGLVPAEPQAGGFQEALREATPEAGAFILFSLRRRSENPKQRSKFKRKRPK